MADLRGRSAGFRPVYGIAVAIILLSSCAKRRLGPFTVTAEGIQQRTGLPMSAPAAALPTPLSSDDAAAIALQNNPQLRADLGSLGIAEADLIDANLLRNPRLDILFPVGLKPFELLLNLPFETLLQRPRRVAASQQAYDQLAQSLIQNGLNTVRDARLAHADAVLFREREQVAQKSAELRSRIADITEARLRAGDIGELDTVAARAEAGSASEQLTRFRHDAALSVERLRLALGRANDSSPIQLAAGAVSTTPPPGIDVLLEKAMTSRPDLRAAELAIASAAKRARWERSRLVLLWAQLSSKGIGTSGILTGPGFSGEIPVFNRNQGLIARAEAEAEVASRQYLALKQRVAFEVKEAHEQLIQAQEGLMKLQAEVLPPLARATTLAEDQYGKGDVAYLFVLEQTRGLIDAQLRVADSEAAVRRAQAQLERSAGTR